MVETASRAWFGCEVEKVHFLFALLPSVAILPDDDMRVPSLQKGGSSVAHVPAVFSEAMSSQVFQFFSGARLVPWREAGGCQPFECGYTSRK